MNDHRQKQSCLVSLLLGRTQQLSFTAWAKFVAEQKRMRHAAQSIALCLNRACMREDLISWRKATCDAMKVKMVIQRLSDTLRLKALQQWKV